MGGRKSYSVRSVLGDLRHSVRERKDLAKAISDEQPQKIVKSTVEAFKKSNYAIENLSKAIDMYDFFREVEKKKIKPKDVRKAVTEYWLRTKEKKKIKSTLEIDRILINSTVAVAKRSATK